MSHIQTGYVIRKYLSKKRGLLLASPANYDFGINNPTVVGQQFCPWFFSMIKTLKTKAIMRHYQVKRRNNLQIFTNI
jgi:hypothetical protein